jgi:hypothetical protein
LAEGKLKVPRISRIRRGLTLRSAKIGSMLLPQLFRAGPGPGPLGAVDLSLPLAAGKDLSVKEYAGGVWASYQSPAANQVLRELNQALRKLGFSNVLDDGVIRTVNVEAVKLVASFASAPAYAGLSLPSGGTAGYAGTFLRRYTNAKALARGGVEARYYVRSLTDSSYFKTLMQYVLTNRPPPAPPASSSSPAPQPVATTPTPTTPAVPPPTFDPSTLTTSAEPGFFQKKSTVWYIVGGILFAGAATAAYLVWKPAQD